MHDQRAFHAPPDPNIKIWRYMDFTKFVAMLDNGGLWFPSLAALGEMDRFEGSYPKINREIRPELLRRQMEAIGWSESNYKPDPEKHAMFAMEMRKYIKVSCWHMNEDESAALWKLYAQSNEGIAIQSTYALLRACLPDRIGIGPVAYIDYNRSFVSEDNALLPAMFKRMEFRHERELRAVLPDFPPYAFEQVRDAVEGRLSVEPPPPGELVQVDLSRLIDAIYVAPTASQWFASLVGRVAEKYGVVGLLEVHQSSLGHEPTF